jgi:carboxyl-terminal processing protease
MVKLRLSTLTNVLVGFLLLAVGSIAGYRLGATGSLPFNIKVPFLQSALVRTTGSALSRLTGSPQPTSEVQTGPVSFDTFWEVWGLLERDYLEPEKIDATKMVDGAIAGMAGSLDDPYTMYLSPTDNQRSSEDLAGSFYGVGIELGYVDSVVAVVAPLKDSPAAQAGVQAGDLIIHVKDTSINFDQDTAGWTLNEAVDHIRGKKGTEVVLTLIRKDKDGGKPFEIAIKRDEIIVKSVTLEFTEDQGKRVAHLSLSKFGERTMAEWDEAVQAILAERSNIKGIVLDLRNNPGGFFDTSIQVASDFVKRDVVVSQKSKFKSEDYNSTGKYRLGGIPVVILVNKGSASAAEIVAGALRDDLSAKLVGEKTFGKGTVQDRRELSNGGGLHITVGRWLLPKGSWIHKEGIPVDVEVKDNPDTKEDEVLLKGIEVL